MEYDMIFTQLSRFAKNLVATEKDRVEYFVNGLKLSLQKDLALCELTSHAEALDKALKVEWVRDQMNANSKKKDQEYTHQGKDRDKKKRPYQDAGSEDQKVKERKADPDDGTNVRSKYPKCGRQHDLAECPMITGACFHCKEKGHMAANCLEKS